jgi:hypothetical protein
MNTLFSSVETQEPPLIVRIQRNCDIYVVRNMYMEIALWFALLLYLARFSHI